MSESGHPHVGSGSCLFHGSESTISGPGAEINSSGRDHNRLSNTINISLCQGMCANPGNLILQNPLALSGDSAQGPSAPPINRGHHSGFHYDETLDNSSDRIPARIDQGTQTDPGNESVCSGSSRSGSQNPLAPSADAEQGPSASPLNPGMPLHCSVTPEAHALTELKETPNARYQRHLLAEGHGFPLWVPQPHIRLPLSYRRKGISVGDVGIITRDGYFDFLFNICLLRGHASNPEFLPINFSPVDLLPTDISEFRQHDFGSFLTFSAEKLRGMTFKRNGPEGSILVMPNGAYHEDLLNLDKFKGTALQNAENWYKFALGTCGREIENGGLRLVTGCDKTNIWGIATYSDFRPGTLTLAANNVQSPVEYAWDYEGPVEAKAGPRLDESLDAAGNQEYPLHFRNQCTFLRAYTVTLADNVWKTMVSTLIQAQGSSDNHILNSREPWTSYLTSIVSGSFLGFGNERGLVNVGNHSLKSERSMIHPATVINQMLLSQYPDAKVAISHDNDWCAVIRENEITMPDTSELLGRVQQTFISHFNEDGTVYLSQGIAPEASPQEQAFSPDALMSIPEFSGCAPGTLSNATGNTHDEDLAINDSHISEISGDYINISSVTGELSEGVGKLLLGRRKGHESDESKQDLGSLRKGHRVYNKSSDSLLIKHPVDIGLHREFMSGSNYQIHSTFHGRHVVAVKVFNRPNAKQDWAMNISLTQKFLHSNVPKIIGVFDECLSESPFIAFRGTFEKRINSLLAKALRTDLNESIVQSMKTVKGLTAGLVYLESQNILSNQIVTSVKLDNFDIFADYRNEPVISFHLPGTACTPSPDPSFSNFENHRSDVGVLNRLSQKLFSEVNSILYDDFLEREFDNYDSESLSRVVQTNIPENGSGSMKRQALSKVPRRELWWKLDKRTRNRSLHSIARHFKDYLDCVPLALSHSRTSHRCPGYLREEIILTAEVSRSTVIAHLYPSQSEICSICGQLVQNTLPHGSIWVRQAIETDAIKGYYNGHCQLED